MSTAIPDTLMGQEMMHARMTTANLLLKSFENRGIRLSVKRLDQGDGFVEDVVEAKPMHKCTDADWRDIEENKESLIARLQEIAAQRAVDEPPKPERQTRKAKKAVKQPYRAMLEELLPQFTQKHILFYDIEQKLRKVGQHALADDSTALRQVLADMTLSGSLELVREDTYRRPSPDLQTLNLLEPNAPVERTETAAPPAPPAPPAETPVAAPEATQEKPPSMTHSPMNGLGNSLDLIVGLAGALAAPPLDAERIQSLETAMSNFMTEIMMAAQKFEDVLKPALQELRQQDNARRNLRAQISAPPAH